ncbi:hypothetical protein D1007_32177 [Hordeum vulgare]|nr:hypothetical protein D1007_32177 [Hordeum vulgare]
MRRKRKGNGVGIEEVRPKKSKRAPLQNRASPSSRLLACKHMSEDRKRVINDMDLRSLRNIKLHVNEESVHCVMGMPRGGQDVPYNLPIKVDVELGLELFGDLGCTPKMIDLVELITCYENFDTKFKRVWLMLAGNIVIALTTSSKASPRWYVMLLLYVDAIDLSGLGIVLSDGHFPLNVSTKEFITQNNGFPGLCKGR